MWLFLNGFNTLPVQALLLIFEIHIAAAISIFLNECNILNKISEHLYWDGLNTILYSTNFFFTTELVKFVEQIVKRSFIQIL